MVLLYVFLNIKDGNLSFFMKGALSKEHAYLEDDCASCHTPWNGVNNDVCIKCHEDNIHFIDYDFSEEPDHPIKKVTCLHCHGEHKGAAHNIKLADNPLCLQCHPPDFMLGRKFKVIE